MANNVFANNREISCKSGEGKTICAFPDTCFTPPENPATPPGVPIPYPNTGIDSDTTEGSKQVKISDKEVMLKNKSYFKRSSGDDAGQTAKKGVVTSVIQGKVYFESWSMDVKFEAENVVRHLDLTTHNHASTPPNSPTWPFTDRMAMAVGLKACEDEIAEVNKHCKPNHKGEIPCPDDSKVEKAKAMPGGPGATAAQKAKRQTALDAALQDYARKVQADPCQRAARCILSTYERDADADTPKPTCCPNQTPHHLIPKSSFFDPSFAAWNRGDTGARRKANCGSYNYKSAPCVCVEGISQHMASHGLIHDAQANALAKLPADQPYDFGTASDIAAQNMKEVFPNSGPNGKGCSEACTKAQLRRQGHAGLTSETPINPESETVSDISKFRTSFRRSISRNS